MTGTQAYVGSLTADPELRYTPRSLAVCSLRLAVKHYVPGEAATAPQFYDVVAFGSLAEHVADCLHKGQRVVVAGTPKTRTWTGRDGKERTTTEIVADAIGPDLRFVLARTEDPDDGPF